MKVFLYILSALGLIVWACCCALGYNYGHSDALVISIIILLGCLLLMGFFLLQTLKYSNPDSCDDKKTGTQKERACLVCYIVVALLTMSWFAHFIAIQGNVITDVRGKVNMRVQELSLMFADEDKEGSYMCYVDEAAETFRNEQSKNFEDEGTIDVNVSKFKDGMMGDDKFNNLRYSANKFLKACNDHAKLWIPLNINDYLTKLDGNTEDWCRQLKQLSEDNNWVKGEAYNPQVSNDKLADLVINANVSNWSLTTILIIIVIQLVILLSYIVTKDWSGRGAEKARHGGVIVYEGNSKRLNKGKSVRKYVAGTNLHDQSSNEDDSIDDL
ncbi:MAG: hypothetical protein LUC88_06645 [Prevotella sp.]|nr:hypothetical protein [Prevotella sp.]